MSQMDDLRLEFARLVKACHAAGESLRERARLEDRRDELPLLDLAVADAVMLADSAAKAVNAGIARDRMTKPG